MFQSTTDRHHQGTCKFFLYFFPDQDPLWTETCRNTQCYNVI